jgi:hypothetical protein
MNGMPADFGKWTHNANNYMPWPFSLVVQNMLLGKAYARQCQFGGPRAVQANLFPSQNLLKDSSKQDRYQSGALAAS